MIVNTRTGQGPAPCKFPCESEPKVDNTEAEVRAARAAVISQLQWQFDQRPHNEPASIRETLLQLWPALDKIAVHQLDNVVAYVIGYVSQGVAAECVDTLCDDPRDFNDLVDAYQHRVDPAQFSRRPNVTPS